MLIGAVALVGCSKDDGGNEGGDPLVTNVTLPAAGTSFASGETVTITGNGFTASDAILFRVPTKATAPTTDIRGYDYHSDGNRTDVRSARRTTCRRKFGDPQTRRLRNDAG